MSGGFQSPRQKLVPPSETAGTLEDRTPIAPTQTKEMLAVGRIVHYVLADGEASGHGHRAAIVTGICSDGTPNLDIRLDGVNDTGGNGHYAHWRSSVRYDASGKPGTWHWPERT